MMLYREYPPCPALAPHVACLWTSHVRPAPGVLPFMHRVLPDNCVDILWQDSGAPAFAVGMMSSAIFVASSGPVRTVAVRFLPGAARIFFGLPLAALTDGRADLADLWGRSCTERLQDGLWERALSDRERLDLIERALIERFMTRISGSQPARVVVAPGSPVAQVPVAAGSPASQLPLAAGSPVTGGALPASSPAAQIPLAASSPAAQVPLAAGAPVTGGVLSTGSPTAQVPLAASSPVARVALLTGSPAVRVPLAASSPVARGALLTGSPAVRVPLAASSPAARVAAVDGSLLARAAVARIEACGGALRVASLADELRVSRQHLAAQFREQVGLSPKLFARITRFRRAAEKARSQHAVDWAALALDCGYFDQSHLIRDFQDFAATTPEQFLAPRAIEGGGRPFPAFSQILSNRLSFSLKLAFFLSN